MQQLNWIHLAFVVLLTTFVTVSVAKTPSNKAAASKEGSHKLRTYASSGQIILSAGDYHCAIDAHSTRGTEYEICNGLPVVVLLDASYKNGCAALVPFIRLFVHSESKKHDTNWALHAPKGFAFASAGIEFSKRPQFPNDPDPSTVYDPPSSSGKSMKLTIKAGAAKNQYNFVPKVLNNRGAECEPADPLIINDN